MSIFHRNLQSELPQAVSGDGVYLIDANGKRYLDASCGAAVSCLGHSNRYVIDSIKSQVDQLPFAHTGFFTSEIAEKLAALLIDRSNGSLDKVYFLSGGSEAIETALKMARQYFVEIGQPQREYFISRKQSYHGNTITALSIGGNLWRRKVYEPILNRSNHIAPCYAYRDKRDDESLDDYGLRVANELESEILRLGEDKVVAFVAETVVGATVGALQAVPGYFKRVRQICDQYGVLLILDEIMCGSGRTGRFYAFEDEDIKPDLVCIAKGLGGGYQPIAATLCNDKIYNAIATGSGNFQHGHTYIGHPTAAAAAYAVQTYIDENNLLENVRLRSNQLFDALHRQFDDHPHVGDVRGRGLFAGVELVADRKTKEPFAPDSGLDKVIKKQGMENGLMLYPNAGTIDGQRGHHVLIAPPFICGEEDIANIVSIFSTVLEKSLACC